MYYVHFAGTVLPGLPNELLFYFIYTSSLYQAITLTNCALHQGYDGKWNTIFTVRSLYHLIPVFYIKLTVMLMT